MVIMSSKQGKFSIQNVEFSPKVITMNETTDYSISITNGTGQKITKLIIAMRLCYKDTDGVVRYSEPQKVFGQEPLSSSLGIWPDKKTIELKGTFKLNVGRYKLETSNRVLPIYTTAEMGLDGDSDVGLILDIESDVVFYDKYSEGMAQRTNKDMFYNLRGSEGEYLTILNMRYNPQITTFSAERSTGETLDDEGENVLATLGVKSNGIPSELYLQATDMIGNDPQTKVDLSELIMDAYGGVSTVITDTFSKNADWTLTLHFGDQYEMATANITLPMAFANVHLSGASTGGVCIGGFSQATEGNPLFQCYYPAEFTEGIRGVNRYELGEIELGGVWIDGKKIYRKVIAFEFAAAGTAMQIDTIDDLDAVIRIDGCVKWSGDTPFFLPITHYIGANNNHEIFVVGNNLVMNSTNAASGYVIIDYTKIA